jgi:hypothetical protein
LGINYSNLIPIFKVKAIINAGVYAGATFSILSVFAISGILNARAFVINMNGAVVDFGGVHCFRRSSGI